MTKELRISTQEMAQYRERLIRQKEFLTDMLSKIEKQILALQVERLHLRNTLLGSECPKRETLPDAAVRNNHMNIEPVTNDTQNLIQQKLDLSVPLSQIDFEEEIEDDDLDFLI